MWLAGDAMKMSYFFLSKESVPWAFKMCGIFQACCDCFLGLQYVAFGNGEASKRTARGSFSPLMADGELEPKPWERKDPRLA